MKRATLAQQVQARRIELGYDTKIKAANAAGVGSTTWNLLESQGKVPSTYAKRRRITRGDPGPDHR